MMPERHFFKHRHLRLSYLDSAPDDLDRPAVLLLHGFPDQATMWMPQIQALHQAGFRCIAPATVGMSSVTTGALLSRGCWQVPHQTNASNLR